MDIHVHFSPFLFCFLFHRQKIQEIEDKEGVMTMIDKKSVMRIIHRLAERGKLTIYNKTLNISDTESKQVSNQCPRMVIVIARTRGHQYKC